MADDVRPGEMLDEISLQLERLELAGDEPSAAQLEAIRRRLLEVGAGLAPGVAATERSRCYGVMLALLRRLDALRARRPRVLDVAAAYG